MFFNVFKAKRSAREKFFSYAVESPDFSSAVFAVAIEVSHTHTPSHEKCWASPRPVLCSSHCLSAQCLPRFTTRQEMASSRSDLELPPIEDDQVRLLDGEGSGGWSSYCSSKAVACMARRHFPPLAWLPTYTLAALRNDAIAGITVGLMVVPQALAYASVAGVL